MFKILLCPSDWYTCNCSTGITECKTYGSLLGLVGSGGSVVYRRFRKKDTV